MLIIIQSNYSKNIDQDWRPKIHQLTNHTACSYCENNNSVLLYCNNIIVHLFTATLLITNRPALSKIRNYYTHGSSSSPCQPSSEELQQLLPNNLKGKFRNNNNEGIIPNRDQEVATGQFFESKRKKEWQIIGLWTKKIKKMIANNRVV